MNPDDQPFRHYSLKHRIISSISRNLFDHLTYTVRHGLLKGMKRRGGLGWLPESMAGQEQSAEHRFLAALDVAGRVVYDIGAFEGLLTLFFAQRARQVVCYEPNPRNRKRLLENLQINHIENVTVRKAGLGAAPAVAEMVWDPHMAGGSTIAGTSMSQAVATLPSARHDTIEVTTLDLDVRQAQLPVPDLIKIDTEGYELAILQGARALLESRHPTLYVELHGETMNEKRRNAQAVVELLTACGYSSILHVESGQAVTTQDSERAAQGHLYAQG